MATYRITDQQKQLLRTIVEHLLAGKVEEPIIPVCSGCGCSIIGIIGEFGRNLFGDLDALCDIDLMGVRFNSMGDKIYSVKQPGYDAVKNDFTMPDSSSNTQYNIGAIIQQMSGGNVQATGFANESEIRQIVNDPQLLSEKMLELTNQLLEAVKAELSAEKLVSYIKTIEEVKKEVSLEKPSSSILQRLFSSLAFMGDVEGAISLTARVWPFIYPMLVVAVEKIFHSG